MNTKLLADGWIGAGVALGLLAGCVAPRMGAAGRQTIVLNGTWQIAEGSQATMSLPPRPSNI